MGAVAIHSGDEGPPQREPYCRPDGEGGWIYDPSEYTEEEIGLWAGREIHRCSLDPVYWATHWVYTINEHLDDPTGRPPEIQIIPDGIVGTDARPWIHPRAILSAFFPRRDVLIEKSRDMMVSWISMVAILHDLLFRKNWKVMTLSRVEDLVDDGGENATVDSLHGKILFMWNHLPEWMRKPLEFRSLSIVNPEDDVHVSGFSATPSAGRGPKWQRAIIDEFAWVPHSEQVMASVTRACPQGKVLVSTPHGKANAFYRIRSLSRRVFPQLDTTRDASKIERERSRHWQCYTVHWSLHPEHDQAWYKRQIDSASMTEESVAQELDISYTLSLGRRVYPAFNVEKHMAGQPLAKLGSVGYSPNRPIYLCCDFNVDPLVWVLVQPYNDPPYYRVFGEICRRNATIDDALYEFVYRFGSESAITVLNQQHEDWEDIYGVNGKMEAGLGGHTLQVVIFGDATEDKSTVYSRVKAYAHMRGVLRDNGFDVVQRVPEKNPPRHHRFQTVNHALRKDQVVLSWMAEQLRLDFETGVWNSQGTDMVQADDGDGSGLTRSHASSALGYMLCKLHKLESSEIVKARSKPRARTAMLPKFMRGW